MVCQQVTPKGSSDDTFNMEEITISESKYLKGIVDRNIDERGIYWMAICLIIIVVPITTSIFL